MKKHNPIKCAVRILVAGTIVSTSPSLAAKQSETAKRPNVVFILADDLGWGDLHCYGHPYIQTPNLDRLAKQGILFTSFYVNAPTCSPSRAGFLTGRFPGRMGIHGGLQGSVEGNTRMGMACYLDPTVPSVTSLLHAEGYRIGHFGKWHLGHTPDSPLPAAYGIDDAVCFGVSGVEEIRNAGRARSSEAVIDESIRFIEENKDKPFYLNVWPIDPHAIVNPSEEQMKPYERFRPKGTPFHGAMQVYFAVVTELDKQIGRLLQKLDELNLTENTIVVFSSDNGPEHIGQPSGEASHSGVGSAGPFRGNKHVVYEGGIRVPFIVRWTGHVPAGKVDNTTVLSGIDFLPTLCAFTGSKPPADMDGEDLSQAFLGKPQVRSTPLMWNAPYRGAWVWENIGPQMAIRDGKWKLLMNPDKSHLELHDMSSDLGELDNAADTNPEVVDRLAKQLLKWEGSLDNRPVAPDVQRAVANTPAPYPWPKEGGK